MSDPQGRFDFMSYHPHSTAHYFEKNIVKATIFEEKSDIWMRIVRYDNNRIGIEICLDRQIINGGPVWQEYKDSVPATKAINFFVEKLDIDLLSNLQQIKEELYAERAKFRQEEMTNYNLQRQTVQLETQLREAHTKLDALQADLRRGEGGFFSKSHPYR